MHFLVSTLTILLLSSLGSCSSAPEILPEERPTLITLKDSRTGTNFFLANEAHTNRVEYYSQARSEANLKVVDNLEMGALMMALDQYDYFGQAYPALRRTPGARTTLMVEVGEEKFSMSMTTDSEKSDIERASNCNQAFLALFNASHSMQLIDNPDGRRLFERQQQQLQTNSGGRRF